MSEYKYQYVLLMTKGDQRLDVPLLIEHENDSLAYNQGRGIAIQYGADFWRVEKRLKNEPYL